MSYTAPEFCSDCHEPTTLCQCADPISQPSYSDLAARLAEAEQVVQVVRENRLGVYDGTAALMLVRAADSADPVIDAQHDETGRMWRGPRSQLPRRYAEVSAPLVLPFKVVIDPTMPDDTMELRTATQIVRVTGLAPPDSAPAALATCRHNNLPGSCALCALEPTDSASDGHGA
jgi:hypothetical protein